MATLGGGPLRIYRQGGRESSILAATPQHTGHLGAAAAMTTTVVEPTAAVESMFLTYVRLVFVLIYKHSDFRSK